MTVIIGFDQPFTGTLRGMEGEDPLRKALAIAIAKSTKEARHKIKILEREGELCRHVIDTQTAELQHLKGALKTSTHQAEELPHLRSNLESALADNRAWTERCAMLAAKHIQSRLEDSQVSEQLEMAEAAASDIPQTGADTCCQNSCPGQMDCTGDFDMQMMCLIYHRLETGKHHLVSEECALSYAWAFLLWTCDYSGEDPVLAQFSKLALQLCSLQHTIFELGRLSLPAHRLQRCYDAMIESLVMKLIVRKEHSTKDHQEGRQRQTAVAIATNASALTSYMFQAPRAAPLVFNAAAVQLHTATQALSRVHTAYQSSIESSTEIQVGCQKLLVLTTLLESGLPHSQQWNLDFCSIEVGLEASVQGLQLVMGLSKTLPLLAEQAKMLVLRYSFVRHLMVAMEEIASLAPDYIQKGTSSTESTAEIKPPSFEERILQRAQTAILGK